MDHVRVNLKREQLLEDRYSQIDRENRILLGKLSDIVKQPNSPPTSARTPGPTSLNSDARKRELLRITKDNQAILKRIQQAQPVYNHVELEGDWRRNLNYRRNCAEFPPALRSARGGKKPSELVPLASASGAIEDRRPASARSSSDRPRRREDTAEAPAESVAHVLKEGRTLGETYYLIEMATDGRALGVTAYDGETGTTLELVVEERVHRRLFRETSGDYGPLADRLAVRDGRLTLLEGPSEDEMDADAMIAHKGR